MCGIFAVIRTRDQDSQSGREQAQRAVGRLKHRGPDASGIDRAELSWGSVDMGMTRLKIVDQSDVPVPYDFPHLGIKLAFNGEIYNWRELRRDLPGPWSTECDAEVVAAAWRKWGLSCLDRLNGVWGFVLVDTHEDDIFVVRDRAGEKPIYYSSNDSGLYVASEIKAFPFELQAVECLDLSTLEFDCSASTPFSGVHALEPGSCLWFPSPEDLVAPSEYVNSWWMLPSPPDDSNSERSLSSYTDELEALVVDAVKIRASAAVPVALQLSGGLDSAIIQAVAPDCKDRYCVTFPDVDNISAAKIAAPNDRVAPITFTREEMIEALPAIAYHLDTPATWTACCQWFMNRQIKEDGDVVVLSGEGADELFSGYSRYRILYWIDKISHDDQLTHYRPLINRALGFGSGLTSLLGRMLDRSGGVHQRHAEWLSWQLSDPGWPLVEQMAYTDFYTTMQVLLRMADRMAAAFSLENRSPFLDYRIMEFASQLPVEYKVNAEESKVILRRVAERLGVDKRIVSGRTKKGLFIPSSWGKGGWDRRWFSRLMNDAWTQATERMNR